MLLLAYTCTAVFQMPLEGHTNASSGRARTRTSAARRQLSTRRRSVRARSKRVPVQTVRMLLLLLLLLLVMVLVVLMMMMMPTTTMLLLRMIGLRRCRAPVGTAGVTKVTKVRGKAEGQPASDKPASDKPRATNTSVKHEGQTRVTNTSTLTTVDSMIDRRHGSQCRPTPLNAHAVLCSQLSPIPLCASICALDACVAPLRPLPCGGAAGCRPGTRVARCGGR